MNSDPYDIFFKTYLRCGKRLIVTILSDKNTSPELIKGIVERAKSDSNIVKVLPLDKKPYAEPKSSIEMEILKADFVVELAQATVLYTKTFRKAIKCGTKFYFLSGIQEIDFIETYKNLDPEIIVEFGRKIFKQINNSKRIKIISSNGQELTMHIGPKRYIPPIFKRFHYSFIRFHSGILDKKTHFTFLPAQIVFRGIRCSVNGSLTFDGSIWPFEASSKLKDPVTFRIKKGVVTDIEAGKHQSEIKKMLKQRKIGDGKTIQHFSIGLNPIGEISGNMLMDERTLGVLTLGVGRTFAHFDITMSNPTIFLDELKLLDKGKFASKELENHSSNLTKG